MTASRLCMALRLVSSALIVLIPLNIGLGNVKDNGTGGRLVQHESKWCDEVEYREIARQYDDLDAEDILMRMVEMHQKVEALKVAGKIEVQRGDRDPSSSVYELAFERPDRFRFNRQVSRGSQTGRYMLQFDNSDIRLLADGEVNYIGWDVYDDPILSVLYGMESHIDGALPYIPYLLLRKDPLAHGIFDFSKIERLSNERKGSPYCMRIRATLEGVRERTVTFWVSTKTLAIERIIEEREVRGESHIIITECYPIVNPPITSPRLFEFDPPDDAPRFRRVK